MPIEKLRLRRAKQLVPGATGAKSINSRKACHSKAEGHAKYKGSRARMCCSVRGCGARVPEAGKKHPANRTGVNPLQAAGPRA